MINPYRKTQDAAENCVRHVAKMGGFERPEVHCCRVTRSAIYATINGESRRLSRDLHEFITQVQAALETP